MVVAYTQSLGFHGFDSRTFKRSEVVKVMELSRCHMLAALDRSLDCWCFSMVSDPDFELGVHTWNRLQAGIGFRWGWEVKHRVSCLDQALLKCVGRGLASSFIAMQAELLAEPFFSSKKMMCCILEQRCIEFTSIMIPSTFIYNNMCILLII